MNCWQPRMYLSPQEVNNTADFNSSHFFRFTRGKNSKQPFGRVPAWRAPHRALKNKNLIVTRKTCWLTHALIISTCQFPTNHMYKNCGTPTAHTHTLLHIKVCIHAANGASHYWKGYSSSKTLSYQPAKDLSNQQARQRGIRCFRHLNASAWVIKTDKETERTREAEQSGLILLLF